MASHLIAVIGVERTGKTTLAAELSRILLSRGLDTIVVPDALSLFGVQHGRRPHPLELRQIAGEQTRSIEQACLSHKLVLADGTALTTASYGAHWYPGAGLHDQAQAEADHAHSSMTLLTSLDLAWPPHAMQGEGAHDREQVDALIREALQRMGASYAVVAGQGVARIQHALSAIEHLLDAAARQARAASSPRWRWFCDHCDDGECEQHWLPRAN